MHFLQQRKVPEAVSAFCGDVADRLGDGWRVTVVDFPDDDPGDDPAALSVAIDATTPEGIAVSISRDRGTDSVLLCYRDCDPVPFEDLAVFKRVLQLEDLAARAALHPDDDAILEPLIPLHDILDSLRDWRRELPRDLNLDNHHAADAYRRIADCVAEAAGFAIGRPRAGSS